MTDLCAERCCRNSETGSVMKVDPDDECISCNDQTLRLTLDVRNSDVDDVYCDATMCDLIILARNFVSSSIRPCCRDRSDSYIVTVDAGRTIILHYWQTASAVLLLLLPLPVEGADSAVCCFAFTRFPHWAPSFSFYECCARSRSFRLCLGLIRFPSRQKLNSIRQNRQACRACTQ